MLRALIGIVWLSSFLLAQTRPHIEFSFSIGDEYSRGILLRCGIDSAATDGLDLALGEYPMPGHPPDGFHAAWEIATDGIADLSYTDFRPYPDSAVEHFAVEYNLNVSPKFTGRGDLLIFRWTYPLPRGIDSVILTDRLGGQLVTLRFGPKGADTISGTNVQLERFILRVFYSPGKVLSVEENRFVSYQLFGQSLVVSLPTAPRKATLYSLRGERIEPAYVYADERFSCSLDALPRGWYMLIIEMPGGKQLSLPLLIR